MNTVEMQTAQTTDVPLLVDLIRKMLAEMQQCGGYPVDHSPEVWKLIEAQVLENVTNSRHLYLLARCGNPPVVSGMIMARLEELDPVFLPKNSLHISAIYTVPEFRRQGIARQLIVKGLEWGRQNQASLADLHVLVGNPAANLYQTLGFRARELEMVYPLSGLEE